MTYPLDSLSWPNIAASLRRLAADREELELDRAADRIEAAALALGEALSDWASAEAHRVELAAAALAAAASRGAALLEAGEGRP